MLLAVLRIIQWSGLISLPMWHDGGLLGVTGSSVDNPIVMVMYDSGFVVPLYCRMMVVC